MWKFWSSWFIQHCFETVVLYSRQWIKALIYLLISESFSDAEVMAHFITGLITCQTSAKSLTAAAFTMKVHKFPVIIFLFLSPLLLWTMIAAFMGSMMTSYIFIYFIQITYQKVYFIISLRSLLKCIWDAFLLNEN